MTIENIKTIILVLLVALSSLLTWNIWTYQPKYDILKDEKTVREVSLSGEERTLANIIVPSKIFYHYSTGHYGTVNSDEIDKVMNEVGKWRFEHFEDVSNEIDSLYDFVNRTGNAEIVFPDIVPMENFKSLIEVKDNEASSIQFDRIVIDTNSVTKSHGNVYFLSLERGKAYRAEVTASYVTTFRDDFYVPSVNNEHYYNYQLYKLDGGRRLPVRSQITKMTSKSYLIDLIPTGQFKDALFNDPSFVKRNVTNYGEEYFDESTLMSVNYTTNMLLYANPAQEKGSIIDIERLLGQSIDYISGHGGWTANYRYAGIDTLEKTVRFRMYNSYGYPIFSNNGISEIYLIWGETGITQYMRNNFSIGRTVETEDVNMPAGTEVFYALKNREGFQTEYLEEIILGYNISNNSEGTLLRIEPTWFYKYKDQWLVFPSKDREG